MFCFPTYYENENQPVNLIEAMAFGLPILTTRWRSIPELFPVNYPGLVEIRSPNQIAKALIELLSAETGEAFREIFLRNRARIKVGCPLPGGGLGEARNHFSFNVTIL